MRFAPNDVLSRQLRAVAVALVATATLLAVAQPLRAAPPPSPCATADALRNEDLLDEAESSYGKLLEDPAAVDEATRACAVDGLAAVDRRRDKLAIAAADRLRAAGLHAAASEAAADALKDPPVVGALGPRLSTELRGLTGGKQRIAAARALKAAGLHAAAATMLQETLTTHPGAATAEEALAIRDAGWRIEAAEALQDAGFDEAADEQVQAALREDPGISVPDSLRDDERRLPWWRETLAVAGPWLVSVGQALALVLLVLAAVRWLSGILRRRLSLGEFTGGPSDKAGGELAAAVGSRYHELVSEAGGTALLKVDASGESFAAPAALTTAVPQVAVVAAAVSLLDRFAVAPRLVLSAELRTRDPIRGAGIRLRLTRQGGGLVDEVTIWEEQYGPVMPKAAGDAEDGPWQRLTRPAAVWLLYAVASTRRLPWRRRLTVLGTRDWTSYAQFAVGADSDRGMPDTHAAAKARYLAALGADARNRGAAFNLALVERLEAAADEPKLHAALTRVRGVLARIDTDGKGRRDPLWFRARCLEVVILLDLEDPGVREPALDLAVEMLDRLAPLAWLELIPFPRRERRARRQLLQANEANALVLAAAALHIAGDLDGKPLGRTDRQAVLSALKWSLWFTGQLVPADLIARVEQRLSPLDAGATYNLASYYALTRSPHWQELLERAFALGGCRLATHARHDAALRRSLMAVGQWRTAEALARAACPPPSEPAVPIPEVIDVHLALAGGGVTARITRNDGA